VFITFDMSDVRQTGK